MNRERQERLRNSGTAQAGAVHARHPGRVPHRQPHSHARRSIPRRSRFLVEQAGNTMFGLYNMFSGGNLAQATIFALGIMPYISASIILQLLTVVWPYLGAPVEGGGARPQEDHASTRGTAPSCSASSSRLRSRSSWSGRPTSRAASRSSTSRGWSFRLMTVLTLTTGTGLHHVARRADYRAGRRQRHVADHLRGYRRRPADGRAHDPGSDAQRGYAACSR